MDPLKFDQLSESLKLISTALNKSCSAGNFNLDEAYLIRVAINNLEKNLENSKPNNSG